MIFTMRHLFVCVVLCFLSTCFASNENEVPSKITVKENFNNPAILNPISPYGPPPIVSNFVHQGTNFFFNPHFLLGNNIPPALGAVVAAIPNVEMEINETVVDPKLPPTTPVEIIVEKPIEVIALPPPPSIVITPDEPEVPVVLREIPPAPVLPPLVMPKIPTLIEESVEVVPAREEKEIIVTEVKPLLPVIIPQPPSLPPLVLPPKIIVPEIEVKKQPPAEPSTVDVEIVGEKDVSSGFNKIKLTNVESLQLIPTLPVAEIDFRINEIHNTNELSEIEKVLSINEDKTMILIPPSPDFPELDIPKPISEVLLIESDKNLELPSKTPTDCARNIIMERVLPNIISKKTVTKSLEIISFPAAQYPVVAQTFIPAL